MNVVLINGGLPDFDNGLSDVTALIGSILSELEVEVVELKLCEALLPYYTGVRHAGAEEIIRAVKEADGVVIASPARLSAPSALTQTFLEHLELPQHNDMFKNKNCMLVTVSRNGGERSALEYLSRAVNYFDGYDSVKLGLKSELVAKLKEDEAFRLIVEKQVEDYYRILHQARRFIIPRDNNNMYYEIPEQLSLKSLTRSDYEKISETEKKLKIPISKVVEKLDLYNFAQQHEDDINELTRFFAQKHAQQNADTPELIQAKPIVFDEVLSSGAVSPRPKTVKQLTQSMPRYFQPQHSDGMVMTVQLNITGDEVFEGYLTVNAGACEYVNGQAPSADITIIADAHVWADVIKGKNTAQKAFMTGKLKVRGNFVMLSRLDQLFKPAPAV